MKWCVSYKCKPEILKEADEIRYSSFNEIFSIKDNEVYAAKRLILEILDFQQLTLNNKPMTAELMGSLLDSIENLFIDFYRLDDLIEFNDYTQYKYQYRFMFHYPVDTYNLIKILLTNNVSDITVTEPIAFDMKNLEHYIHYDNPQIKIRIRPYVGRNSWMPNDEDMCHFWVLPQHIKYYEPYVYVVDILANDIAREETLYNIYKRGNYELDLAALIEHFDTTPTVKGVWIDDAMALQRVNCRQICQSTKPQRCHLCQLQHMMLKVMPRASYTLARETQSQS